MISLIWGNVCFATNVEIANLKDAYKILDQADQKTLVIFNVDDVLIATTDEFNLRAPIRKKLNKELKAKYDKQEINLIFSDFFAKRRVELGWGRHAGQPH